MSTYRSRFNNRSDRSGNRDNNLFVRANRVFVEEAEDRPHRCNNPSRNRVLDVDNVFIRANKVIFNAENNDNNHCC